MTAKPPVTADHAGQTGGEREMVGCVSCGHVDFAHTQSGCARSRCTCTVGWRDGRWITEADRLARRLSWFTDDELAAELARRRPVPMAGQAALHEWECPSCGATTRARMADHPTGQAAREAAVEQLVHEDIRQLLEAAGLGTHARPYSTHEVVQRELLPAVRRLAALSAAGGQET